MLSLCCVLSTSAADAGEPTRLWVDQTGAHALHASIESVRDGVVFLKQGDGSQVKIPSDQLSFADQEYLASWVNRSSVTDNKLRQIVPNLPVLHPQPVLDLPLATSLLEPGSPLQPIVYTEAERRTELPTTLLPDPQSFAVQLKVGRHNLDHLNTYDRSSPPIAITVEGKSYLAVSVSAGLSSEQGESANRVIRFDPDTAQVATVWRSANPITLLDHHPTTGLALVLDGHQVTGSGGQLAIAMGWEKSSLSIKSHRALPGIAIGNPIGNVSGTEEVKPGEKLHWARWIDDDHIVAAVDTNIAVWNFYSGELKHWICRHDPKATPSLSAGRRYLAVPSKGIVELFRTKDGKSLGRIPIEPGITASAAFSPRGDAIALVTPSRLRVWELSSAMLRGEVKSKQSLGKGAPVWIDNDLVLSSSGILMSVYRGLPLWRYDLNGASIESFGGKDKERSLAMFRRRPQGEIAVVEVPHATLRQTIPLIDQQLVTHASGEPWELAGSSVWGDYGWADRDLQTRN